MLRRTSSQRSDPGTVFINQEDESPPVRILPFQIFDYSSEVKFSHHVLSVQSVGDGLFVIPTVDGNKIICSSLYQSNSH